MSNNYWFLPRTLQGRVEPDFAIVPDGANVFCLGADIHQDRPQSFMLDTGDEVTLYQDVSGDPAHKLIRFAWLVRNPRGMPQGRIIVNAGPADFKDGDLAVPSDALKGVYVSAGMAPGGTRTPFLEADRDQLIKITGTGLNDGTFRISAIPQDQGNYDNGTVAVIENAGLATESPAAATIKVLGAQWRAEAYIDANLRAQVIEPAGYEWQRLSLAMHLSQNVTDPFRIKFVLALDSVEP